VSGSEEMSLEEAVCTLAIHRDLVSAMQQLVETAGAEVAPVPHAIDVVLDELRTLLVDENCTEGGLPVEEWEPCGICRIFPPRACAA
jgi:hypothetical protein